MPEHLLGLNLDFSRRGARSKGVNPAPAYDGSLFAFSLIC
jgi:hypothetical protein